MLRVFSAPKSVSVVLMFDMCPSIYFIIRLFIKIFAINLYLQCGTVPSQEGPLALWEVAPPEPTWHCCSYDQKAIKQDAALSLNAESPGC